MVHGFIDLGSSTDIFSSCRWWKEVDPDIHLVLLLIMIIRLETHLTRYIRITSWPMTPLFPQGMFTYGSLLFFTCFLNHFLIINIVSAGENLQAFFSGRLSRTGSGAHCIVGLLPAIGSGLRCCLRRGERSASRGRADESSLHETSYPKLLPCMLAASSRLSMEGRYVYILPFHRVEVFVVEEKVNGEMRIVKIRLAEVRQGQLSCFYYKHHFVL